MGHPVLLVMNESQVIVLTVFVVIPLAMMRSAKDVIAIPALGWGFAGLLFRVQIQITSVMQQGVILAIAVVIITLADTTPPEAVIVLPVSIVTEREVVLVYNTLVMRKSVVVVACVMDAYQAIA
jgi:hypothetical protein